MSQTFTGSFSGSIVPAPPPTINVTVSAAADPVQVGNSTLITARFNPAAPSGSTVAFTTDASGNATVDSGVLSSDGLTATANLTGVHPGPYTVNCALNTP